MLALSHMLGKERLYPAIDAVRSTSRLLDPTVVGMAQFELAMDLKKALQPADNGGDAGSPSPDADRARATRLQRFMTQPFFVAEPFTKRPGRVVPRATAIADVRALLDGERGDVETDSLYMIGALDDVAPPAS